MRCLSAAVHLVHGPLATSTAHTDAVNNVSLLGLEPEATSLVWAGGAVQAHDAWELTVLPAAHTQQETEHITLLLLPKLLNVLQIDSGM